MRSVIILVLLVLQGCAIGYGTYGGITGVYAEKIEGNDYKVGFRGNGFSNPKKIPFYVQTKASEVGIQLGYRYFSFVENGQVYVVPTYSTGGESGAWTMHSVVRFTHERSAESNDILEIIQAALNEGLGLEKKTVDLFNEAITSQAKGTP